jgi:hypothetical protein
VAVILGRLRLSKLGCLRQATVAWQGKISDDGGSDTHGV